MVRSELILYSVLAIGGVAAAYWASLPVDKAVQEKVVVQNFGEVKHLTAESKQKIIEVVQEGKDRYLIKESTSKLSEQLGNEPAVDEFVASKHIAEILKALAPLRAERSLGEVTDAQISEFGLSDPELVLIVGEGQDAPRLSFGMSSFGTRFKYFRIGEEKQVYLVDYGPFGQLTQAKQTLMERNPFGQDFNNVAQIRAEMNDGNHLNLYNVQKSADKPAKWADQDQASDGKATYDNIVDKLSKCDIVAYAEEGDLPLLDAEPTLLKLKVTDKNGQDIVAEIKSIEKIGANEQKEKQYYMLSSYIGKYVRIPTNRAVVLVDELTKLLSKPVN